MPKFYNKNNNLEVGERHLVKKALREDIGSGDITTTALISSKFQAKAQISAKQDLVLSGQKIAAFVFQTLDRKIKYQANYQDGDFLSKGETIATIQGKAGQILQGERVALNFLQHLSGVATLTRKFVEEIKGTKAKIVDTRKTIPGLRVLEKEAVCHGGGENHRLGLFDRYLIKNNHIDLVGSIEGAIEKVLKNKKPGLLVEVEVRDLEELQKALQYSVDIILLDNFSLLKVSEAIPLRRGGIQFEVSGGITLDNVRAYAETGVDFISIGALTHSAPAADMHLVVKPVEGKLLK